MGATSKRERFYILSIFRRRRKEKKERKKEKQSTTPLLLSSKILDYSSPRLTTSKSSSSSFSSSRKSVYRLGCFLAQSARQSKANKTERESESLSLVYFLKEFIIVNETLNLKHRKKEGGKKTKTKKTHTHTHTHTQRKETRRRGRRRRALKSVATEERERERREHGFRLVALPKTIIATATTTTTHHHCAKTQEEKGKTHPREGVSRPSLRGACTRKSYMHRDAVSHAISCASATSDFFRFGSRDGHVKFWKKSEGMNLAKHFRAHVVSDRRDGLFRNAGRD